MMRRTISLLACIILCCMSTNSHGDIFCAPSRSVGGVCHTSVPDYRVGMEVPKPIVEFIFSTNSFDIRGVDPINDGSNPDGLPLAPWETQSSIFSPKTGFDAGRWLWHYFLAGAWIVFPAWLLTRLLTVFSPTISVGTGWGSKIACGMRNVFEEYGPRVAKYNFRPAAMCRTQEESTMTKLSSDVPSGDQAIKLNPLEWKPEHRAGLGVASAAGAAVGIAIGFGTTRLRGMGFTDWIGRHSGDTMLWAVLGALVVGAAIYCCRVFSAEDVAKHE
jgi:hypothetical protein